MTGTIEANREPTNTARTTPLTALKAVFGLSDSRRAARSDEAPRENRAKPRATCIVSHGPPRTRPAIMRNVPT
jgi:hypothetical protein